MTSPGNVPYLGDLRGGTKSGGTGVRGKDLSNENRCQGGHLNSAARCLALPSLPGAPLSPFQPARSLARTLALSATRRVLNKLEQGRNAGVKLGKPQLPRS